LVQVGLLVLLVNLGVLNWNLTIDLLNALPYLLIAIGIEKIFTRSKLEFISYIAVSLIFVGGIYIAFTGSYDDRKGSFFDETTYVQEFDPQVKSLRAVLRLGAGNLEIRDVTDDLVFGRFAEFTSKPRIRYELDDGEATVALSDRARRLMRGVIGFGENGDGNWTLYFSRVVPLTLECHSDEADLDLNLATTPLRALKVDADDADIYVRLGRREPTVNVELSGYNSDLRLRLPEDAGVRITGDEYAAYMRRIGLLESGGAFVNEGYDSLEYKISIELDERFDGLEIKFY
jgi:hypothetical protein